MNKIYAYCRISRQQQSIERQIRNIKAEYQNAIIIEETFTGTSIDRPNWNKLYKIVKKGDTIIFDSVSRMSRSSDEGVKTYFELYSRGVNLIFLKEHYIDTAIYTENIRDKIELNGSDEDEIFKGLNNYFRKLAERQIKKYSRNFDGTLTDLECIQIIGISRNTYYKYKKELTHNQHL